MDTAERLLGVAEELLSERGPDGVTVREVARRAGLTPMAVYRHFDGVDALRDALRARGYQGLAAAFHDVLAEPDARSRLEASARRYTRWALDHPAMFRLMFTGGPAPEVAATQVQHRRDAAAFRFLVDRIREAMDAGVVPRGDPEARAIDWWALCHGLAVLQQEGKLRLPPDRFDAHLDSTLQWLLR
ncbi:MAG: TetR/AcrR family transcriptional regulator [Myxococcota bacterium]